MPLPEAEMRLLGRIAVCIRIAIVVASLYMSVRIRLYAVINYGRVIHEFDPWFNYRATEYMAANGYDAFQVRARRARRTPRHGK